MGSIVHRIVRVGPSVGNLFVSTVGGFVFLRGFRLIAMGKETLDAGLPMRGDDCSLRTLAGIDAAVFLLAFVASETLAAIAALRH